MTPMLSVVAPAIGQSDSQGAPVTIDVRDTSLRYGQRADVRGRVSGDPGERRVALEHRRSGGTWRAVASAAPRPDGSFRILARLARSGGVRVVLVSGGASARSASGEGPTATAASEESRVRVAGRLTTSTRRLNVVAGRRALVRGVLKPASAGRTVRLQLRTGKGWRTVDRSRTRSGGRYTLSYRARKTGTRSVRVSFPGDSSNAAARRGAGRLNVYRRANASWYGPGLYGNRTGCGGRLSPGTRGVAHKSLPCGTKVTFRHRGRSVRVRVIDRGPYVGGREYDLTAATARAIGFRGHGSVLATR